MKKKDAKLPPPKKLKLSDYEVMQTLGTGKTHWEDVNRFFWKGEAGQGGSHEKVLCHQDSQEGGDHKTQTG